MLPHSAPFQDSLMTMPKLPAHLCSDRIFFLFWSIDGHCGRLGWVTWVSTRVRCLLAKSAGNLVLDQGTCILTISKFKESTLGPSIPHFWLNPTLYLKCCAHQEPKETVVAKARESLLPHADPFKETKPFQVALSWSGDGRPLCRFPRRWVRCCYHRNYCYHLLSITPWQ